MSECKSHGWLYDTPPPASECAECRAEAEHKSNLQALRTFTAGQVREAFAAGARYARGEAGADKYLDQLGVTQ